jgi:hypothetical protein
MEFLFKESYGDINFKQLIENDPLLMNHLSSNKYDILYNKNNNSTKLLKDNSTKIFNDVFFEDKKIFNLFLFYIFQQIHYDIISKINNSLTEFNEIIKSDEYILIVYKGGNVINYYINKNLDKITNNIKQSIEDTNLAKISDIDLDI